MAYRCHQKAELVILDEKAEPNFGLPTRDRRKSTAGTTARLEERRTHTMRTRTVQRQEQLRYCQRNKPETECRQSAVVKGPARREDGATLPAQVSVAQSRVHAHGAA